MRSKEFISEDDDREFSRKLDKYYRDRAAKAAATKARKDTTPVSGSKSSIVDKAKDFWAKHGYGIKKAADEFYRWQQADLKKTTMK
jgi:hypothetical protein